MQSIIPPGEPQYVLKVDIPSLLPPGGGVTLSGIRFSLGRGECLAIIGPNGSGKSTLLRAIGQQWRGAGEGIQLLGRPLSAWSRHQRARRVAILAQNDSPDLRLSLEDYVALGRLPYGREVSPQAHQRIITDAISDIGLQHLRTRALGGLSGGERQRAALARVLAQTPELVLLDEPTNHLDPPGRVALLSLVKRRGITAIAVLHDLSLVSTFADRVLLLSQGRAVTWDIPDRVLVSDYLYPTLGVTSFRVPHPETGKTLRIFDVPVTEY